MSPAIPSGPPKEHGSLPASRFDHDVDDALQSKLSEAILSEDNDLDRLLREALQIAENLKSKAPAVESLRTILRRSVECAVRQSILDGELRSMALTDALTGLHNRRGFIVLAEQQIKLAIRNMQGVLLFYGDVDRLKEINDRYGHEEGDRAVARAARCLKHTFRDSDIVARLGGDEFAVLAFEASSEYERAILQRLKKTIQKLSDEDPRYTLSLSMGCSRFDPENPVAVAELIARADQAMYHSKRKLVESR